MLVREFNSEVPSSLDDLTTLPGVGRKTANVVLSVWFDKPGLPVDTHVLRVSNRIGLISSKDPVKVEYELNELVLPRDRGAFSIKTILHGRQVCIARKPRCGECKMKDFCLKRGVNGI
jgi:endonuclease-3